MVLLEATVVNVALPSIGRDRARASRGCSGRWTVTCSRSPRLSWQPVRSATSMAGGACSPWGRRSSWPPPRCARRPRRSSCLFPPGSFKGVAGLFSPPGALPSSSRSLIPVTASGPSARGPAPPRVSPCDVPRPPRCASAPGLALVAYPPLGGVIFFFVAFLQLTPGYRALQAGAATLPVTALMLILSRPSGAIAQRIGPRIPLAIGAVLTGAGLLLMAQIHVGDRYLTGVLPSLVVFGVGLAALITPITATVLASVGSPHSGIASSLNNAFSRLRQLVAVSALPLAAGLSGTAFENPARIAG